MRALKIFPARGGHFAHNRKRAGSKCRSQQIGGRKAAALPAVVWRQIGLNRGSGRPVDEMCFPVAGISASNFCHMEKLLNKTPAQNVRVYYKIQKNEKNIKFFAIIKKDAAHRYKTSAGVVG